VLELREIVKHYRAGDELVRAVDGVSLTLNRGEVVALYGPSGSGKTTLLLLAAGMTAPDEGEVRFDGRDVARLSVADATCYRRAELGFVWQQFHLIPRMAAIDNVGIKLLAEGVSRRAARERAEQWIERVGLAQRRDNPPERLSTGERQRVAIARALVNRPRLVLADEPTGNLDSSRAELVLGMLAEISHNDGVGVLLVTHDPEAAAFADRVLTLRDGKLLDGRVGDSDEPLAADVAAGAAADAAADALSKTNGAHAGAAAPASAPDGARGR
jgi:putative ABC transport system ATP-binding protein